MSGLGELLSMVILAWIVEIARNLMSAKAFICGTDAFFKACCVSSKLVF